jgi:hypothetical protein
MTKNYQILLDTLVNQERLDLADKRNPSDFFEFFAASQILKSYELSYEELDAGITGKSHDGGADAIYLFVNDDLIKGDEDLKEKYKKTVNIELIVIQAKNENSFGEDTLLKFSKLGRNLFDLGFNGADYEGRYNEQVIASFELFRNTYLGLIKKRPKLHVKFCYVSKGDHVHPNVERQKNDLITDINLKLPEAHVTVEFIGAQDLFQLAQQRLDEEFSLKISESPLSTKGKVFIVLVRLSNFFEFITNENRNLIKHIFESNVRDYQGKTTVNNEIQETLEEPESEDFWWLNNGITILATDTIAPGGRELIIQNPEIVNGLQTSSEIFKYFTTNPDKLTSDTRDVLVRVIVPQSEESRSRIIRATNSQTPIPKASLRATDDIHRQIEEFIKTKNLFYDRRKNFYKNEGKKPKDIISLPFMSQCLMSVLLQQPDTARARPSTLLDDDTSYEKLFHKNNDLITYFLLAYFGRFIELELKANSSYSVSEVNDIKFYVLYALVAQLTGSIYPTNAQVSKLNDKDIDFILLKSTIEFVYDTYKRLGGNEKIAKGSLLISTLKDQLRLLISR